MGNIKKIAFWTIWFVSILIKLPIAVMSVIIQYIELKYTKLQTLLVKWYGEEWAFLSCNDGIERDAETYERIGDMYRKMKIEL